MKKILSKSAIGMFELICAAVLVAITVLGMCGINSVLNKDNQDFGQRYLVNSETQATLNNILNNAALAVGNYDNSGILIGQSGMGDPNSFCIHQLANGNTTGMSQSSGPTPDIWQCYTLSNYQINSCTMPYDPTKSFQGAAGCAAANSTFLGTAYSITNVPNAATSATFSNVPPPTTSPSYLNGLFTITIQNCLVDSASTCSPTGASADPANNPEVVLTGNAFASQQSLG